MSGFYDDMRTIASGLFTTFNQGAISYVRTTVQAGATPDAPAPSLLVATLLDGAVARGVQYKYVSRGLAVASDLQVSFAGDAISSAPSVDDFIDVDGSRLKIVHIVPKPAAGPPVAYTLIVRK